MATRALTLITRTAQRKSYLLFKQGGRWLREEITDAEYDALGNPPKRPRAFTGTPAAWTTAWRTGQAKAIKGRPVFTSADGQTTEGSIVQLPAGRLFVFLGDIDNDGFVDLSAEDYTGIPPLITVTRPLQAGVSIVGGILTRP